jgi:hypothetical protein
LNFVAITTTIDHRPSPVEYIKPQSPKLKAKRRSNYTTLQVTTMSKNLSGYLELDGLPVTEQVLKGRKDRACEDCGFNAWVIGDKCFIVEHDHEREHLCPGCAVKRGLPAELYYQNQNAPPPPKRQKTKPCTKFPDIKDFLREMETKGTLVDFIETTWNKSQESWQKMFLEQVADECGDRWVPVEDSSNMLGRNWKIENDDNSSDNPLLLEFKAGKVRLGSYGGRRDIEISDLTCAKRMGFLELSEGGCEECGSDENYEFVMERNMTGKLRLLIEEYVECRCGGDDERCEESSFVAYET